MFMQKIVPARHFLGGLFAATLLTAAQSAWADPQVLLVDNNAFRIAFGLSLMLYDRCGGTR